MKQNEHKAGEAFSKENYILMGVGLVFIVVGFLFMMGGKSEDPNEFNADELYSFRRITLAPIVVFIGYIIEIYALFRKPSHAPKETVEKSADVREEVSEEA